MPHDEDPNRALLDFLRRHAPELRPICRWLMLGPYICGNYLQEFTRPPTVRELVRLKRVIEGDGHRFNGMLRGLLEASGKSPAVQIEIHLDRLVELDPSQ